MESDYCSLSSTVVAGCCVVKVAENQTSAPLQVVITYFGVYFVGRGAADGGTLIGAGVAAAAGVACVLAGAAELPFEEEPE